MKYVSLHVAVHHPLITVNQSLKGTLGNRVCSIPRASGIDLQLKNITGTGEGLVVGGHEERDGFVKRTKPCHNFHCREGQHADRSSHQA